MVGGRNVLMSYATSSPSPGATEIMFTFVTPDTVNVAGGPAEPTFHKRMPLLMLKYTSHWPSVVNSADWTPPRKP